MADSKLNPIPEYGPVASPDEAREIMSPLRLSEITTPTGHGSRNYDMDSTAVDSGHDASEASTATAGWELHVSHLQRSEINSEVVDQLRHDVGILTDQNQLLRQKIHLIQSNSNLKQAALISTVISWFGDKGLLEEDPDTAGRLTTMLLQSATERAIPSVQEKNEVDDIPWRRRTLADALTTPVNDRHLKSPTSSTIPDDTSKWLSPNMDSSFRPPFSSSKKKVTTSRRTKQDETTVENSHHMPAAHRQDIAALTRDPRSGLQKSSEGASSREVGSDGLDTRLQRLEKAARAFDTHHAETKAYMTSQRQKAVQRFRVWKAIAASRRLAAVDSPSNSGQWYDLRAQSITPTPLTQFPLQSSADEGASSKNLLVGDPSQTILGEIAFQAERRILAFVFQGKEMLFGYNLGNLEIMIRTHSDQTDRSILQRRYDNVMDVLRSYGWLKHRHPQFVHDMIGRYGIMQDVEAATTDAMKRGWYNPSDLKRGVLCLCPVVDVLDMLIVLDSLLHLARCDGLPIFLW